MRRKYINDSFWEILMYKLYIDFGGGPIEWRKFKTGNELEQFISVGNILFSNNVCNL